ncbi:hypothetical protein H4R99_000863 [Coemansia sp. RSA 1722]|nr:hypothetical protein LPJ57_000333 [Coemansia sp. RSA 486]KAJ2233766.1 hypothetical protein IWW45_003933 [Coemansia sp. RSA 485]KAJ2601714.1 hypothetical protein GGF39_001115 [Coemansia sp. RSA 1721]KAJ2605769.1 hypothetical protein H4R99_000863 [Coemansia sp. RSA 1722]KAJ2639208.1 hypothetical protein GGF40_001070 [Coemansia sp. RSA 1286]
MIKKRAPRKSRAASLNSSGIGDAGIHRFSTPYEVYDSLQYEHKDCKHSMTNLSFAVQMANHILVKGTQARYANAIGYTLPIDQCIDFICANPELICSRHIPDTAQLTRDQVKDGLDNSIDLVNKNIAKLFNYHSGSHFNHHLFAYESAMAKLANAYEKLTTKYQMPTLSPLFDLPSDPYSAGYSHMQVIDRSIASMELMRRLSSASIGSIDRLLEVIKNLAVICYPTHSFTVTASLFGSRVYGLSSKSSDVDISLTITDLQGYHVDTRQCIDQLYLEARHRSFVHKAVKITGARVPILKLATKQTADGINYDCDISFNNSIGTKKTSLIRQYIQMDPRVGPVLFVLKQWAAKRLITNPGVLNTYALMMMGLAFLIQNRVIPPLQLVSTSAVTNKTWKQLGCLATDPDAFRRMYPKPYEKTRIFCLETGSQLPYVYDNNSSVYFYQDPTGSIANRWQSPNKDTATKLLYNMFSYYGSQFNPYKTAVSPRLGRTDVPRSMFNQIRMSTPSPVTRNNLDKLRPLIIEDPLEVHLSCGRNAPAGWVECFMWEMRRAAWTMLPENHNQGDVLDKIMLKPTEDIYWSPVAWASVYRFPEKLFKQNEKNELKQIVAGYTCGEIALEWLEDELMRHVVV